MDWIRSTVPPGFELVHFDSVESPILPGVVWEVEDSSLEKAQDQLGSVLWLDAVSLFLKYLRSEIKDGLRSTAVCLGEGTGAVGCGIAPLFSSTIISDLPALVPLLELNAKLNSNSKHSIEARAIDWANSSEILLPCDVIIGCEVLYGNRDVWPHLLATIVRLSHAHSTVYLCVTLRNARKDIDDFRANFLSSHFDSIVETQLSPAVSVLKAKVRVRG